MANQDEQDKNQLEADLGELENRLERLRVLYEQYFMGIEKREPGVQRKDVDRRIVQLRRARFPSTAMRFKFQTTVQRYNTLQQYWNRTCREIENGTYRRHLQLAERRLEAERALSATNKEAEQERAASAAEARDAAQADLAAMLNDDVDLDAEMGNALAALDAKPADDAKPGGVLGKLGKSAGKRERPVTHATLHLDKAPELRSKTNPKRPDAGEKSAKSKSPAPQGLPPRQKRSTTANPLAALGKKKTAAQAAGGPPPAPSMRPKSPAAPAKQPAPAAKKPTPAVKKPAATAKKAGEKGLSADRIRNLHASYSDARKKTNASAVSFEKLERNIRETEKKLRAKHKGRNVDFEVGIKNGKAILKPKLK